MNARNYDFSVCVPKLMVSLLITVAGLASLAQTPATSHTVSIRQRISPNSNPDNKRVALTLDACSGLFDADLILFLIRQQIPATIFVTGKWLRQNPQGLAMLKAHHELFDIENHGENHIPAIIGPGRQVYGLSGQTDLHHLRQEVLEGARTVERATGVQPHWYRGAAAVYDPQAADEIRRMGYKIAGFSVSADGGATLNRQQIESQLRQVTGGDVIIAHMNKPQSDTAQGLSAGLQELRRRGLVFVRLNEVELVQTNPTPPGQRPLRLE
jgi:peptidoglycan/xylan/chitin deacetylase (PgdA/CDA1 family)